MKIKPGSKYKLEQYGEWKKFDTLPTLDNHMVRCSRCGSVSIKQTQYCPDCGAKMQIYKEN